MLTEFVCNLNLRVSSVDAALSLSRHSVLVPISKRIGWPAKNQQIEELMQGFAHKSEVAIFGSAVGVIPGVVESDGVEGAVYQGRINLCRDRFPNAAGVQRTLFHELLHYGLRRFMPKEQFIAHTSDSLKYPFDSTGGTALQTGTLMDIDCYLVDSEKVPSKKL